MGRGRVSTGWAPAPTLSPCQGAESAGGMWGRLRPGAGICRPVRGSLRAMGTAGASRGGLADKVALVTASTEGIGFAVARRLAQDGAHVVLSSRKQSNVDRAVAELRAQSLSVSGTVCHVGRAADRERLVATALERHGGIDILVSNAAVNPFFGSTLEASEDVWNKILQINVTATALLVGLVVPHMEKRGGGSIVLVSSIAGFSPFPALGPYSVSKTALLGLTKALAPELGALNIRINCLAPGIIQTNFSSALWKDEAVKEKMMKNLRLQRLGVPSDCAGIVSFLCSPDASYITGETVVVGGGAPSRL